MIWSPFIRDVCDLIDKELSSHNHEDVVDDDDTYVDKNLHRFHS